MYRVSRRYDFAAAHRLYLNDLSEEENVRLFGKCANPFGHGHNYTIDVRVEGDPDPETGFVADRKKLDKLVSEQVIKRLDRVYMNCDVPEFSELTPTTENLSIVIGRWLQQGWTSAFPTAGARLAGVRIQETARNSLELTF